MAAQKAAVGAAESFSKYIKTSGIECKVKYITHRSREMHGVGEIRFSCTREAHVKAHGSMPCASISTQPR